VCFLYFGVKKGNGEERREKREERRRNEEEGRMNEATTDNPSSPKGLRS
jgi:hypothetical protein